MLQSLTLVLSGQAGQGLQTIETLLDKAIAQQYHVYSTKEVMSRVRGGNNTIEIRIAAQKVYAYKHTIDMLFLLNDHSFYRLHDRINEDTIIFGERSFVDSEVLEESKAKFQELSLLDLAKEAGSVLFSNTVLFGFISGLIKLDMAYCNKLISERFTSKSESVISKNIDAFKIGFDLASSYENRPNLVTSDEVKDYQLINGHQAISIGAIAGGVNYVSSYPMSPGTGVLEYLANKGEEFDILVEQAEDEIAAVTMTIGAWYAGARAITTTSGGGFALMEEAVSLSGITETPAVIHIAMRPGPGTGLPTRTEQADLNLAVYSGHGEFPRIVLAPGSLEDGILLGQKAFHLADKYQLPVFILSDQFYLDSKTSVTPLKLSDEFIQPFIVESEEDYLRYKLTDNGISPRAIPGHGKGLVKCDSDEHDERGSITEDFNVRIAMNDKRIGKENLSLDDFVEAELVGPSDYTNLVIGWGSTYGVLREAVLSSPNEKIALLHLKQVYPLSDSITKFIDQADKTVLFENNATGQLANLINLKLNRKVDQQVLKYNGMPFTIEEVDAKLKEVF